MPGDPIRGAGEHGGRARAESACRAGATEWRMGDEQGHMPPRLLVPVQRLLDLYGAGSVGRELNLGGACRGGKKKHAKHFKATQTNYNG